MMIKYINLVHVAYRLLDILRLFIVPNHIYSYINHNNLLNYNMAQISIQNGMYIVICTFKNCNMFFIKNPYTKVIKCIN